MRRPLTRSIIAGMGLLVLVLAGCASGSAAPVPQQDTVAGVTVPDAFTALTVVPIGAEPVPFRGSDGKYHLVYDLFVTNATTQDATFKSIAVVNGADPKETVVDFSGTALVDPDCASGNCNRLRSLPAEYVTSATIAPQESRILFIDFAVDALTDIPAVLLHRVTGTGATSPAFGSEGKINYLTTPLALSTEPAPLISAPLRGNNWVALNGCCDPGFPHRSSTMSVNGKMNNSQRFAIDWKQTNSNGEFYTGDKNSNTSYVDYGAEVLAVADGTVVSILDGMAANKPGTLPAKDPKLAADLTVKNVDGNHVVLDLGDGVYAMYAHMISGSITVSVGDTVSEGDVIGELGNTGNANASHLHFQLMNGPSLLNSDSLPYELKTFEYWGQVDPRLIENADDFLSGSFLDAKLKTAEPRTAEMPLNLSIVEFSQK